MEQDQLLHCKGPQVGLSLTSGEKSLRILPSQGPAVLGFSLDFPHDSLWLPRYSLPTLLTLREGALQAS